MGDFPEDLKFWNHICQLELKIISNNKIWRKTEETGRGGRKGREEGQGQEEEWMAGLWRPEPSEALQSCPNLKQSQKPCPTAQGDPSPHPPAWPTPQHALHLKTGLASMIAHINSALQSFVSRALFPNKTPSPSLFPWPCGLISDLQSPVIWAIPLKSLP